VLQRHGVALRERPNGPVVAVVGDRTEFGSPRTFAIFARRGAHWFGVAAPELRNDQLGWINVRSSSVRLVRAAIWIGVDLSRRQLTVNTQDRVLRRIRVAIGRPESPTPVGRFAITDKLAGADFGSAYGCCILALSGHQTRLPPGWTGGDRLAIHATSNPQDIGGRVSAGCVRALDTDLRYLMRVIPLGTAVLIRS
jgi:lipoprotein-anchoring transpeptidase ErfK/SrfK